MKKILFASLLFSIVIFISCSDEILNNNIPDDALIRPIIFLSDTSLDSLNSDNISIESIQIINDVLIIDATYLGGCQPHSSPLFSRTGFLESSPPQLNMRLIHHSYSDTCIEVISERFYFDLKSVATLYKIGYQTETGSVLLRIYDSDLSDFYKPWPLYEF